MHVNERKKRIPWIPNPVKIFSFSQHLHRSLYLRAWASTLKIENLWTLQSERLQTRVTWPWTRWRRPQLTCWVEARRASQSDASRKTCLMRWTVWFHSERFLFRGVLSMFGAGLLLPQEALLYHLYRIWLTDWFRVKCISLPNYCREPAKPECSHQHSPTSTTLNNNHSTVGTFRLALRSVQIEQDYFYWGSPC